MSFVVLSALFPANFISFTYRKITGSRTSVLSKVRNCAVPPDHLRSEISFSRTSSINDIQPFYRWEHFTVCVSAWLRSCMSFVLNKTNIWSVFNLLGGNTDQSQHINPPASSWAYVPRPCAPWRGHPGSSLKDFLLARARTLHRNPERNTKFDLKNTVYLREGSRKKDIWTFTFFDQNVFPN